MLVLACAAPRSVRAQAASVADAGAPPSAEAAQPPAFPNDVPLASGDMGAPPSTPLLPSPVVSSEVPKASGSAPGEEPGEPPYGKKKKNKKKLDDTPRAVNGTVETAFGTFEAKGRVFVMAELERRHATVVNEAGRLGPATVDALDLLVRDARVGLHYRAPTPWLTAEVELRVSQKPRMKDAYIQAKGHHFTARFGRFKMPMSSYESASTWELPSVRHGLLHELLVERLDVGGRRPGAQIAWRGSGAVFPRLVLGAFQGSVLASETAAERDTDLIEARSLRAQSFVARAEIDAPGVVVGTYYEDRVGSPTALHFEHYWTAGIDATLDEPIGSGVLRAWVDGIAGESWFELREKPRDDQNATFVALRALLAYRFGGLVDEAWYIEPYGLGAVLDPDLGVTADAAWEAALGVNAGMWQRARLTLQGEVNKALRNFPTGYFVGPGPDRMALLLQAGVGF
ncbi:MAG TPA: hypothetical protein VJT73_05470 [Polyangiaceae bacterium]|nr:hypothetical protein [Polyangiaceae bacterium]